jgi:hypothetical protein
VTDQLSDLLHERADQLPVFVRSADGLRREAERARSQRRRSAAVSAIAVVAAGIVGAAALLGGGGRAAQPVDQTPRPNVTQTPTPPEEWGLLVPSDLPTGTGLGRWTGRRAVTADQAPFCLARAVSPESTVYVEFTNTDPGVEAYQAILVFPAGSEAHVIGSDVVQAMKGCGSVAYSGYDSVQGPTSAEMVLPWNHRSDVGSRELVLSQHGRYASLLWVSAPDARLDSIDERHLLEASYSRVYEGTEPATRGLPPGTLAAAMLGPADVPFGTTHHGNVRHSDTSSSTFTAWHLCDPSAEAMPDDPVLRGVLFVEDTGDAADLREAGGQRLYVTTNQASAGRLFTMLNEALPQCPARDQAPLTVSDPSTIDTSALTSADAGAARADEAHGWSYRYDFTQGELRGQSDVIYAVFIRAGSVVSQIWRRERVGPRDPGEAAIVDEAAAAVARLRQTLPADAADRN